MVQNRLIPLQRCTRYGRHNSNVDMLIKHQGLYLLGQSGLHLVQIVAREKRLVRREGWYRFLASQELGGFFFGLEGSWGQPQGPNFRLPEQPCWLYA